MGEEKKLTGDASRWVFDPVSLREWAMSLEEAWRASVTEGVIPTHLLDRNRNFIRAVLTRSRLETSDAAETRANERAELLIAVGQLDELVASLGNRTNAEDFPKPMALLPVELALLGNLAKALREHFGSYGEG
jgi:hypothetical protein